MLQFRFDRAAGFSGFSSMVEVVSGLYNVSRFHSRLLVKVLPLVVSFQIPGVFRGSVFCDFKFRGVGTLTESSVHC